PPPVFCGAPAPGRRPWARGRVLLTAASSVVRGTRARSASVGTGSSVAHGRLQYLPERSRIAFAPGGPQLPGAYVSGSPLLAQCSMIGSRISHESSTASFVGNNDGSPSNTSRINRSYASGDVSVNEWP